MATIALGADDFQAPSPATASCWWTSGPSWCGPCRIFAPVFEAASETHPDIVFGKVDTEAEQELAAAAGSAPSRR